LDRAAQKRQLLTLYQQQQARPALNLNKSLGHKEFYSYQRVEVTGRFDKEHQFLLDNRVHQGRAGYQVITPLIMAGSNQVVLVNRGWLPQTASRNTLPVIPTPVAGLTLEGQLKLDVSESFNLGESGFESDAWPRVIQWLEMDKLEKSLGYKVQEFVILQSPDSPAGFVRDWYIKKILPEKSISYAVQWFALALALVIIYLVVNTHKVNEVRR
jgi:surfeit locus 1 family protein